MQVAQAPYTLSLIFTIAVVACLVIQAAVFIGLYFAVSTALKKLTKISDDLTAKAMPIIGSVRTIVEDVTPKVKTVSSHVVDITATVRDQTQHVNSTVDEVVDKTRVQAEKVDDMVSAILGSIVHAGTAVQEGVAKPVRQVNGVLNGFNAAINSLRNRRTAHTAAGSVRTPAGRHEVVEEPLTHSDDF